MNCIQVRKQKFAAMKSCDFKEEYSEGYFRYKSAKYPRWFIGFPAKGSQGLDAKAPPSTGTVTSSDTTYQIRPNVNVDGTQNIEKRRL